MAALGSRLLCLDGMNLDVAPQYLKSTQASYIKNLYYQLSDFGDAGNSTGANAGLAKPLPSNEIYVPIILPEGDSSIIGVLPSKDTNECYVFAYNSLANHFIFRINGLSRTIDIGAPNPCFNFILQPQYFIGEGQCHVEIIYVTDPDTGEQIAKKDLYWTDGKNYQGYLRFDDYLATNGFDAAKFQYFIGNYDKCPMVRMGLPTPNNCIKIDEVPFDPITDTGKNNNIKDSTWQFRILDTDVFGRPSEHAIISDLVFVGENKCLGASDMLSRCWDFTFDAGNPLIDKIQVEYRNCNEPQWYLDTVLDLYEGSNVSEWWLRTRNPDVIYNATTNKITYRFCKDKLCDPIDVTETNRVQPALPRVSQSVSKIGTEIALSNNKDGFPPFKKGVLDKIKVIVTPPVSNTIGQTANIEVYIRIFNPHVNKFQKVWKKDTYYVFGGIANGTGISNIYSDYQQYFPTTGQKGYIGYLAGTNNYAVGVQYYLDSGNNFIEDTDFTQNYDLPYFMKFTFNSVPKNVYVFRIASQLADSNVVDVRTTSTYVGGTWNFSNFNVGTLKNNQTHEIVIDVCNGDYSTLTSGEILLTYDLTDPKFYGNKLNPFFSQGHFSDSAVGDGYIFENVDATTGKNEFPVPLLQLLQLSTGYSFVTSLNADHNGFYYASAVRPTGVFTLIAIGYCNCIKKELIRVNIGTNFRRYATNLVIGNASADPVTTSCVNFDNLKCSRILIKGKLQLCNGGIGIPNINVVVSRGGYATTDANGEFTIIAYDDVISGSTIDQIYVMGGACAFTSCDGGCIEVKTVHFSPCTSCNERDVDAGTYSLFSVSSKGLLSGGRYGVCIFAYDWLGRRTFARTTDNLYFNIPTLNQLQMFGFSTVGLSIPSDVTFDSYYEYLTVGITVELNYGGNLIEWIADKVTFVDNSGNENDTAPTQIRIDYSSLNQYNANNNFNTTTGWQIIPTDETSPRVADEVQFFRNGDGKWFPNPISALVKYDKAGEYFLINYTDALKDLKENALIRLANPTDCTNKDQFFELCNSRIDLINGKAQTQSIILNAYDTYYQYRQIPVPVTQTVETGTPPVPVTSTIIELRQFGFPFEHPSVTDTWGYHCWNIGRFGVKNPYENEIISADQLALSGVITPNAQLNYLNYFDDANKYSPIINSLGGIVYARFKTGIGLIVGQFKSYLIGFNDNIPTVNEQGQLIIPSAADRFGNPMRDTVAEYGCLLFDKNTIREKNGLVQWLDRSKVAILQHDYSQCIEISRYSRPTSFGKPERETSTIVSWLTKKIRYQDEYNKINGNTRYFHAVINPLNLEWILSEFTIGGTQYVNTERQQDVTLQETISFDTIYQAWKQFMSPTPEMFGYLDNTSSGQILFSFKNGVTYSHTGKDFNTFFGIACEAIYEFIFNTNGFDKKKFQAMNIYCVQKILWSDLIQTETQVSRLLKGYFRKHDHFYSSSFLCDLNTNPDPNIADQTGKNVLTDGDTMFGSYIKVRLIADADGAYFELYGVSEGAAKDEQSG